mmetsp:Transcript_136026/g.290809  ORF Transcript_136026/g.290809 Transcript_136026/m.290809 type:complete len:494 (-) Transcript_136026:128-1609(-)
MRFTSHAPNEVPQESGQTRNARGLMVQDAFRNSPLAGGGAVASGSAMASAMARRNAGGSTAVGAQGPGHAGGCAVGSSSGLGMCTSNDHGDGMCATNEREVGMCACHRTTAHTPVYMWTEGGDWVADIEYRFVGGNRGNLDRVMMPSSVTCRWGVVGAWILFAILVSLGPLWLVFQSSQSTTTTSTTSMTSPTFTTMVPMQTPVQSQARAPLAHAPLAHDEVVTGEGIDPPIEQKEIDPTCLIYGDPHIRTFDGMHADYYTEGEFWLVKSDILEIQARYMATPVTHGLAVTKEIAISGRAIKNKRLVIGALGATWQGSPILKELPSNFEDPGLVRMRYDDIGEEMQKSKVGMGLHVVHVDLLTIPMHLDINRWNEPNEGSYINLRLILPGKALPGQDGHCGNFNSNAQDDERMAVRARLGRHGVPESKILFLDGKKTPISEKNQPDLDDCPQLLIEKAHTLCKAVEDRYIPSKACLIDVCFGGKTFAAEDVIE